MELTDGFNASHTLAYSIVALQELNLAYRFPILFWNCSCLITDSGGNESEDIEEEEYIENIEYEFSLEDFTDDDEEESEEDEEEKEEDIKDSKKKKKTKTTNFGKIATAIGRMTSIGIIVSPPDINKSSYTFAPDLEHNMIMYGLSGITRIGEDLIQDIIDNRPYSSLTDFMSKLKVNKLQMINLIKSGAFDQFGSTRASVMEEYIDLIADKKKRITLQNMKMLIDYKLLPEELNFECKVFNFNKYLKKFKYDTYYLINDVALKFYENNYDMDKLYPCDIDNCQFKISQAIWDTIYKKAMDPVRIYIKNNGEDLLNKLNNELVKEVTDKYCTGSISKWEMDSVSYYSHKHELDGIDLTPYGVVDYYKLPDNPIIDKIIPIKGNKVPIYKIFRIAGTVIDKSKTKKTVTLLTTSGVVTVRIFGEVYPYYDKQISQRGADGKKHVIRKSEFNRGNKIIVCGIKQDNMFTAKKYKATPYHLVETIEEINNGIVLYSRNQEEEE